MIKLTLPGGGQIYIRKDSIVAIGQQHDSDSQSETYVYVQSDPEPFMIIEDIETVRRMME